jgi:Bacterial Alpha-2-macroglobulin MG10 domain/Alpha-2-macroglobulin family/MG2 domain
MTRPSRRIAIGSLALMGMVGVVVLLAAPTVPVDRAAQWKKVDEAVNKGLPKTAIQELEPIIAQALKDKAYPEAIRAISKKIALEGTIQGNKPEERITRMKAEIAKAPPEMVPVMDAVLAHWYWHYFQQNSWRFMQRTATSAPTGEDFTTWDLKRLFSEIDKQFTKALAAEKELKSTPIATYDALLEKGSMPDAYRPTLYDFVAFDALQFYTSGEQAGARPEDAFEISSESPALAPAAEFLTWQPQTTDTDAPKVKAIKLYQNLLNFHKNDQDKSAYLDADLSRLQFANANAFGDTKAARYKTALAAFVQDNPKHELSSMARDRWATTLHAEGDSVQARKIAADGQNAFPNSPGGKLCHNLVLQIEAREVQVVTERVWTDPLPLLRVTYRNIDKVHFRAVKYDWPSRLTRDRWRPEQFNPADRNDLVSRKPELEWSVDLTPTPDYHQRVQDIPAPKELKPGFYFIVASPAANFGDAGNTVSAADVWVSDLALVMRQEWGKGKVEGFVLNAKSGDPIANAKIRTWVRQPDGGIAAGPGTQTDQNGLFVIAGQNNQRSYFVLAESKGQELATANEYQNYQYGDNYRPNTHTILFTDRSLYRPGQTVHFKGICLIADTKGDSYKVIPNRKVNVVFNDPNGKEIAKAEVVSNDFGSFSGSFTAPRDRLAGQMHILVPGEGGGAVHFNVEEYKRPKFQVTVEAPKEAPKLNDQVKAPGKATAYTGAPIGGAKVRYRVTREVRWPAWFYECCWWRIPPNRGVAQEIAHGSAVTEADGSFIVTFVAKPDLTVPEADEPTFHYTVHADVTDSTGETRSGSKAVIVGYTALQANLTASDWQTVKEPIKVALTTQTLDGEGQAAKGTVKVYRLKSPQEVIRPDVLDRPIPTPRPRGFKGKVQEHKPDPADPRTWDLGDVVSTTDFATNKDGKTEFKFELPVGLYRAVVETKDRFDKAVTSKLQLRVLKPDDANLAIKVPEVFAAPKWSLEPGEEFMAVWGTGYDKGRAFVEIEHRGKILQSFWTDAAKTQVKLTQAINEGMRGGFTVRATYVRENRGYMENRHVDVPWSNKDLTVKWEHFVNKLEPGKKETFTAVVSGPKAEKATAEMVATLYDASLDAYLPHHWMQKFNVFRHDGSNMNSVFENGARYLQHFRGNWNGGYQQVDIRYRALPADITVNMWGYMYFEGGPRGGRGFGGGMPMAPGMAPQATALGMDRDSLRDGADKEMAGEQPAKRKADGKDAFANAIGGTAGTPQGPDLSNVSARKNLDELAFFFPHLSVDGNGSVRMEFTMPEALTKWKFMGFAHDKDLRSGYLQDELVTAKDLMVEPNPPRFLREGDILEFSVKVTNQSKDKQAGKVRLSLSDLRSTNNIDAALGNTTPDQAFALEPGTSQSFFWKLTVPDDQGPISYKAVGASDKLSDGEEGVVPVLSKRVLVTESIALPIRGPATKTFDFKKLEESAKSNTLKHQTLTIQMCSQPAWYAVMALPYLMEYPHECTEQTFNRLYANALARHIGASDPTIRKVFDQWKNTPALDSPLQKNQDLKSVMVEETPWLRDAVRESEARRNVGILFDENRLNEETARTMRKIGEMQGASGAWPWFPGGPENEYITLYITTGFGRLRHLGVQVDQAPAVRSLTRLDAWADRIYRDVLRAGHPELNHLSSTIALYLYGRSYYLQDKPIAKEHAEAVEYWRGQARKFWLQLANRQSQAHLALALQRFGEQETPQAIMKSIRERSVIDEELGMFWRDTERSMFWYHAPIETQAVMIEAFAEVANDPNAVEECKVWLLKQKQTQNWKTTKATADAVYALLLRGDKLLSSDALVEVSLANNPIKPEKVEAGTGFYEERFVRGEIKPEMGKVTVKKTDAGVSWGSLHWQYLEDVSKVTVHDATPLRLEKSVFKRTYTKKGPVLEEVKGPVAVGDELIVRVVLRTDRDMEYVHLKDSRGSGTEPVNVISRYKYQDGLGYYESTKDTASHFFIDYLPKGTYVFEYAVRVQHKGKYPTGLATLQCMYAPEFNSHSGSVMLEVK